MKKSTLYALSLLLLCAVADASPLKVELRLETATALAGVPVGAELIVKNVGGVDVEMPRHFIIVASPAGEQPFTAAVMSPRQFAGRVLAPGETAVFDFLSDGTFLQPPWFSDARMNRAGVFELRAYIGSSFFTFGGGESQRDDLQRIAAAAAATSNAEVLTVREPSGADAEIWATMRATADGSWRLMSALSPIWHSAARPLIDRHPGSVYAGLAAATGVDPLPEQRAERLRRLLSNTSHDAFRENRLLQVVAWEVAAACEKDSHTAAFRAAKARAAAALKAALASGIKTERARKRAAELSDEVDGLSELEALTPR